jgi:hypothetical protein
MGDDHPIPGTWTRHARFSLRLQVTGRFFSREIPWPTGPRKPGQFSARQGRAHSLLLRRDVLRSKFAHPERW